MYDIDNVHLPALSSFESSYKYANGIPSRMKNN